ncbi:uncharacterized protein L969DRAFT_85405 [Mixia osmundae IAM 14324]|uniref:MPN domain-containing protein n=1 Tax=Mixia osmundae (strain CBS 9802 / IAM 14324 / JCM 22182 / KY 12970) TaxID=764103 RepID=G7DYP3_MIXOS|nr:uncharacterized protein L969DRAFT_85405 [Mixia osmundae IAM 14324]KEI41602.1 hypothetical protein L969DRAFT_85405 [Mixia osmundae IAM 14324]GAA95703.1 hypothetical protein E5Q_02360 [Mixia osmundae IAM 14324]
MASTSSELLALSATTVVIHPLVLLSAVDHASRAAKGSKKRVVGILLGQETKGKINVTNSYAVPFEEDEKDPRTWFMDHNYIENMNDMFRKVNAREKIVGWYHSGPKLRSSDLEINEVVKQFSARPTMVIIDVRQSEAGGSIPTEAYFSVEEIKDDGTATQKTFMHIPSVIEAEEAEEIGVEHLLRDIKDLSTGTLSSRVSNQLASLQGLRARLDEIRDYLNQVALGELPVNHQILYNLQDMFNLLPALETAEKLPPGALESGAKRPFTVATNDQLLVMYLSSVIRTVISLHNLVNNKMEAEQHDGEATDASKANGSATPAEKAKLAPLPEKKGEESKRDQDKGL